MWGHGPYQFNPADNYFFDLFSLRYKVVLDRTTPDLLIYSCFGLEHKKYKCFKIFFSGENIPNPNPAIKVNPDYSECDISLTKFASNNVNLYFPLWAMFINWFSKYQPRPLPSNPTYLTAITDITKNAAERSLKGFDLRDDVLFINNNFIKDRVMLFLDLQKYVPIDSYGQLFTNVESPLRGSELDKHKLLLRYKTSIAFENSHYPGYNTEKIIQPYAAGCIPIYSGGLDQNIFNKAALIYAAEYSTRRALVERIVNVCNCSSLWEEIVNEPLFVENTVPHYLEPRFVLEWIGARL